MPATPLQLFVIMASITRVLDLELLVAFKVFAGYLLSAFVSTFASKFLFGKLPTPLFLPLMADAYTLRHPHYSLGQDRLRAVLLYARYFSILPPYALTHSLVYVGLEVLISLNSRTTTCHRRVLRRDSRVLYLYSRARHFPHRIYGLDRRLHWVACCYI